MKQVLPDMHLDGIRRYDRSRRAPDQGSHRQLYNLLNHQESDPAARPMPLGSPPSTVDRKLIEQRGATGCAKIERRANAGLIAIHSRSTNIMRIDVRFRSWIIFAAAGCLISCDHSPPSHSMPAQAPASIEPDPPPHRSFVNFSDPDADEYIVRDINPGGERRWTLDHPELKFTVAPKPGLRFKMDFSIAEQTFKDTGPVEVVVKLNGNVLSKIQCGHPGEYHLERPVPLPWLEAGRPVHVTADAWPLWTAPGDGAHLGYLIQRAGFL